LDSSGSRKYEGSIEAGNEFSGSIQVEVSGCVTGVCLLIFSRLVG
jgi:hypothetical protein